MVMDLLGKLGTGFDCASKHEIESVIETMSSNSTEAAEKLISANPYIFQQDNLYARRTAVNTVTFDSESDLVKLSQE